MNGPAFSVLTRLRERPRGYIWHGTVTDRQIIESSAVRDNVTSQQPAVMYIDVYLPRLRRRCLFLLTNTRRRGDDALPYTRGRNDMECILSRQNEPGYRNSADSHWQWQFRDNYNIFSLDAHYPSLYHCILNIKIIINPLFRILKSKNKWNVKALSDTFYIFPRQGSE